MLPNPLPSPPETQTSPELNQATPIDKQYGRLGTQGPQNIVQMRVDIGMTSVCFLRRTGKLVRARKNTAASSPAANAARRGAFHTRPACPSATDLCHLWPYWNERRPELRIADNLYNEFGHTPNHFLYERCIDAVIVESDFMRAFVKRSAVRPEPRVEVVHSGIDAQVLDASFQPRTRRKRLCGAGRALRNRRAFLGRCPLPYSRLWRLFS